jgi:hypothetical protein
MAAPHVVLEREAQSLSEENQGSIEEKLRETEWTEAYLEHEHRLKDGDPRLAIPLALYLDGVKFTRSIGPRQDSLIAITCYSIVTKSRHLICTLSKRELCACGCRGWDSLFTVFDFIRWSLQATGSEPTDLPPNAKTNTEKWRGIWVRTIRQYFWTFGFDGVVGSDVGKSKAGVDGIHPTHDVFGAPIPGETIAPGTRMTHRFILVQIKADWMEMASSIGLPQWGSFHAPCPMCAAHGSNLYNYEEVSLEDDAWGQRVLSYNQECDRCEIKVQITSNAIRSAILIDGGLYSDPHRHEMGRVLANDVLPLKLRRGDRIEPSSELRDTSDFESRALPFVCTFWRQHRDARGRLATFTLRRNPLFDKGLGTSPVKTLHLDTLHTLYLGIFMFYCHAVIWAMFRANVFQCDGPEKAREVGNLDVFFSSYKKWCADNTIPLSYQLGQLKREMIGAADRPSLKTKAAETGVLLRFCVRFCKEHCAKFNGDEGGALLAAGESIESYMGIIRASPFKVPMKDCRQLLFLCLRFLRLMQRFGAKDMPKGHLFVHVSKRVRICGNPRFYSTFWDEGLNLTISNVASSSHRANWHETIFTRVRLLPHVQKKSSFALV